ncbi:MAG: DUF1801 domain-containing protein [Bacillota bacterium]|nr:DUF1801 domain-containing protein [Bacillota bacterium]
MEGNKITFRSIDEYISQFPPDIQDKLITLRQVIKEEAPDAEEKISYQMPAFTLHGILVYFAAFKNHIGFYPTSSGIEAFKSELSEYKWAKGSIQFPLERPLPYDLIKKMVRFKVDENKKLREEKLKKGK